MPTLCAIAALFLLQALGDAVVRLAGWPLPGSVLGMLMLLGGLLWLGRVPDAFERSTKALLPHMMLLFIPSVTGVMLHVERVAREWRPILIGCVLGTVVTLVVTALTLKLLLRGSPAALGPTSAPALAALQAQAQAQPQPQAQAQAEAQAQAQAQAQASASATASASAPAPAPAPAPEPAPEPAPAKASASASARPSAPATPSSTTSTAVAAADAERAP